jgi:hypothetical protein
VKVVKIALAVIALILGTLIFIWLSLDLMDAPAKRCTPGAVPSVLQPCRK